MSRKESPGRNWPGLPASHDHCSILKRLFGPLKQRLLPISPATLALIGIGDSRALRPVPGSPIFPLARAVALSPVSPAARAVSTPRAAVAAQTSIDVGDIAGTAIDVENRALPASISAAAIGEQPIPAHTDMGAAVEIGALRRRLGLSRLRTDRSGEQKRAQRAERNFHDPLVQVFIHP